MQSNLLDNSYIPRELTLKILKKRIICIVKSEGFTILIDNSRKLTKANHNFNGISVYLPKFFIKLFLSKFFIASLSIYINAFIWLYKHFVFPKIVGNLINIRYYRVQKKILL